MIIPLGHDEGVSRIPYVTVSIMVICLGVQIYASVQAPSDEQRARIALEQQGVLRAVWREHRRAYYQRHAPDAATRKPPSNPSEMMSRVRQEAGIYSRFVRDFKAGKVVDEQSLHYRRYHELERKKVDARGVFRCGYTPQGPLYTLVTYAFVHGGWLHLIGNLLFLWLCGCNMEDRWGPLWWSALYLGGGVVAALAFALARGWHVSEPLVGASGAVAAAMGAFLVVHHKATIRFFYFFWYRLAPVTGTFQMRAFWALPLWFGQQLIGMMVEGALIPVAYSAHVGGFVVGVGAALAMKASGSDRRLVEAEEKKATVFEQSPLLLEATALREAGQPHQAREKLEQLLRQDPHHVDGAVALFNVLVAGDDGGAAAAAGSRALLAAVRAGDQVTARQVAADLRGRFADHPLEPRALFALGEGSHKEDAGAALDAYQQLIRCHPESPLVPKVLLRAAALYAGPFAEPLTAQKVLQQVLERYADSPFADQARIALEELNQ